MWKDAGNKYNNFLECVLNKRPVTLPHCCSSPKIHHFIYEHQKKRGSAWVWCSTCKSYAHYDGVIIPAWHKNNPAISISDLSSEPISLEAKKDVIDSYNKR